MKKDLTNVIGYIYKIISPNGKIYIGQTLNHIKRKSNYKHNSFKKQIKLWNNSEFYLWNPSETFEIIEECLCGINKENLNNREKYWINFYDSFKNGLNCNEGGHGNIGHKHSEISKEKMRLSHLGEKHTEERNKKKSEYTKGRKHSLTSKKKMSDVKKSRMNDTIKNSIRIKLIGNKNGLGNKGQSKKILCTTNNIVYPSIKEASKILGICETSLNSVLKKRKTEIKGLKFIYYE